MSAQRPIDQIPTPEILQDIKDSESEISQYRAENAVLSKNATENKVRIYLNNGHIGNLKSFIDKLNNILKERKDVPND